MNSQKDKTNEEINVASKILNQCGLCEKKLDNLSELNEHMKSEHSLGSANIKAKVRKEGKFPCKYCGNSFSNSSNRSRHMSRCSLGEEKLAVRNV